MIHSPTINRMNTAACMARSAVITVFHLALSMFAVDKRFSYASRFIFPVGGIVLEPMMHEEPSDR
jgi:hypothetical protein